MALVNHRENVKGRAQILAIGTANPKNCFRQADYPDYYFRITKSDHLIDLKAKFKRMCMRQLHVLNSEWKTEKLDRVLEFGRTCYELINLLGLKPSVKRFMLYHLGCYGGGTVLRLAKDLAENNPGSRVLVVCCEIMSSAFHGPPSLQHAHLDILTGHAIFGDRAGAVIVGCVDPSGGTNGIVECGVRRYEQPLFEIHSAYQTVLPDSEDAVGGLLREAGLIYYLSKRPRMGSGGLMAAAVTTRIFENVIIIFHPAGRPILDKIDAKLGLNKEKLRASRHVLRDYGNMWSLSVLFVLDEMRKGSIAQRKTTTGEGFEWGILLGFGPGVTVETVVLRSVPMTKLK
ncbi:2-pyrone synthase-like [Rhododendron vialii]|uniref:2-pyrone synthase-like n=1 Tax=Rhododendron vialii TaxID=182163 RepID=UPI00265FDFF2|nr:2-pyrone synthase-like [Rhododendron vialii]